MTQTVLQTRAVAEQFDLNTVKLAGTIIKLWGRNRDVFVRLRVSLRGVLRETEDVHSCYMNLRIADGLVKDSPVTLQVNDVIRITGYATHVRYDETLRRFLNAAGEPNFIEEHVPLDDREAWRAIAFSRQNAIVNVLDLHLIPAASESGKKKNSSEVVEVVNFVDMEGIVANLWEYPRDAVIDRFIRIAVYDEHAPAGRGTGNFGRVLRLPHYINILFPGGRTSTGKDIVLKKKQRLRVRGEFCDRGQVTTLHESLMGLGSSLIAECMQRVDNPELLHQITLQQESLHLLAKAVVVYG